MLADLDALAQSHDIITLGMRADEARRALHGTRTTFVRVADVSAEPGAPIDIPAAAGEARIVGVPRSREAAIARVREVARSVGRVPLSGFSLHDLEHLSAVERITLRELLEGLQGAGLELVADAPLDRLQNPCRAVEEVNIAGLTLARLTIHRLPEVDGSALLKAARELQRGAGVIRAFAPLPRRLNPAAPTTGFDDVRRIALARLFVENIPSIQVDWSLYGPKLAQVALTVGADDVDGVSAVDSMSEGRRRAPLEEIRRNIRSAGFEPVERNGRFETMAEPA